MFSTAPRQTEVPAPDLAIVPRARRVETALLGGAAALVIYLVSGPLALLVLTAFRRTDDALPFEPQASWSLDNFARVLGDSTLHRTVLPQTLVYVAGAVAITMVLSVVLAWLVERSDLPARPAVFALIVTPIVIPTVVKAIAWVYLWGPSAGYGNRLLRWLLGRDGPGPVDIYSLPGLVLVQGLELVPLGVVFMTTAFRRMDARLEEASAACGAHPLTTFRRVTLPILTPAALALLIVVTTLTVEMVEVPLAIGVPGGLTVFSSWMFFAMNPSGVLPNYGRVAAAVLPVFAVGVLALAGYNRATGVAERYATVTGKGTRANQVPLGGWRTAAVGLVALYLAVTLVVPALVMLVTSLFPTAGRSATGGLGRFSVDAYRTVFADPTTHRALLNTVIAGALGATMAVALATLVSWLVVRTTVPGRRLLDVLTFAPITMPAVIMGFAIALLYLVLPVPIYGTVWILAVAYATRLAVASRIMRAALTQIHRELEEASLVSGAPFATTLRRVIGPLVAPAMFAAWLLLFVVSFREFTLGMVLYRPRNVVLGVHLWKLYERGDLPAASALGFSMVLAAMLAVVAGRRILRRGMDGR